eukprot:3019842-Pyramimonas_sp.AAC.1
MSTSGPKGLGIPMLKSVSILVLILLFGHFLLHHHLFHFHISHHTPHGARTAAARTGMGGIHGGEAHVTIATGSTPNTQSSVSDSQPSSVTSASPTPSPAPAPPPKHIPVWRDHLPPPPASIMLTFGSKSVADFILNWYGSPMYACVWLDMAYMSEYNK